MSTPFLAGVGPGPAATGGLLRWREYLRYRELMANLVAAELKAKYRGSLLGFLWSLLNPLALILVYSMAFRYIIRIPVENFTVFLVSGLLPWTFFAASASSSTVALMANANLLKKVYFPRAILPTATVVFNLVQMVLALAVFLPSLIILRHSVPWTVVFYPVVMALHILFVVGVALALSALTVVFRDLRHLTEVGLALLFWLTPIVYPPEMVPGALRPLLRLNPMAAFTVGYQDVTYWGRPLSGTVLLTMAAWAVGMLFLGWLIFQRRAPYLAEDL